MTVRSTIERWFCLALHPDRMLRCGARPGHGGDHEWTIRELPDGTLSPIRKDEAAIIIPEIAGTGAPRC